MSTLGKKVTQTLVKLFVYTGIGFTAISSVFLCFSDVVKCFVFKI